MGRCARDAILHGTERRYRDAFKWNGKRSVEAERGTVACGVLGELQRAWEKGSRKKMVERFCSSGVPRLPGELRQRVRLPCPLRRAALSRTHLEAGGGAGPVARSAEVAEWQARIARDLLTEIERRANFLVEVGLGYPTLDRGADTPFGREAQRIRLAAQLGAGLQGVLYVLDEPSIGRTHGITADLGALAKLRDAGKQRDRRRA